jgi:hypothetical protein
LTVVSVKVLAGLSVVLLAPLSFDRRDFFFFPEFELLEPWLVEPWFCVERLPEVVLLPEDR